MKKFEHHPQAIGYACAKFSISTIYGFCSSAWRRMCSFWAFSGLFLTFWGQILLQSKNFFQKSKGVHHLHTRCHLRHKFNVLRPSQPWDIALRETHPASLFRDPWSSIIIIITIIIMLPYKMIKSVILQTVILNYDNTQIFPYSVTFFRCYNFVIDYYLG